MTSPRDEAAPRRLSGMPTAAAIGLGIVFIALVAAFFTTSWQGYPAHSGAALNQGADIATAEALRRVESARLMNELMSGRSKVGGPFELSDGCGTTRRLAEFRGKVVVLYFGYSTCPDVCPTDLSAIGNALRALGDVSAEVQPLFVTLDPERDNGRVLKEFVASFHPGFVGLRGTEAQVTEVARSYKIFHEKVAHSGSIGYVLDHSAFTFILDRNGDYVMFLPPSTPADRIALMLREVIGKR